MAENDTVRARCDKVFENYSNLLYRIALVELKNREDAEDAVQDTFIKYLKATFIFSSENEEKAWLVKVLTNTCRDLLRKRRIRTSLPLDEALEVPDLTQEQQGVFSAISRLSEKHRTPIVLHYLEDFSIEEISKALALSRSAVKMRLMRGREELSLILGKENGNV